MEVRPSAEQWFEAHSQIQHKNPKEIKKCKIVKFLELILFVILIKHMAFITKHYTKK